MGKGASMGKEATLAASGGGRVRRAGFFSILLAGRIMPL
jgi:hypothetical protein